MRNMQTKRFYNSLTVFKISDIILILILCKQFSRMFQLCNLFVCFCHFMNRIRIFQPVGNLLFRACFIQCEYVIDNVVHHMHRAAVHIQNDIITVIFILMNLMIQRLLNPP